MRVLFRGRINRTTYMLVLAVMVLATIVLKKPSVEQALLNNNLLAMVVVFFVAIPLLIWQLSVAARRFHDIGFSGWYSPLILVPLVQIVLLFLPGQKGPNKYGEEPTILFDLEAVVVDKRSTS
jgi:uncharacterized membrane protein YhaH (DUF805 family)